MAVDWTRITKDEATKPPEGKPVLFGSSGHVMGLGCIEPDGVPFVRINGELDRDASDLYCEGNLYWTAVEGPTDEAEVKWPRRAPLRSRSSVARVPVHTSVNPRLRAKIALAAERAGCSPAAIMAEALAERFGVPA